MDLNDAQKAAVREWVAAGASLSEVQKRLHDEFGVRMTYMDVRLMVLDIGAEIHDKPAPKPEPKPAPDDDAGDAGFDGEGGGFAGEGADGLDDAAGDEAPMPADEGGAIGGVTVDMDRVVQPGMIISGTVDFSDGVSAKWGLDRLGRLSLQPSQEGYRPSKADQDEFLAQLRNLIAQQGYGY